MLQFRFENNFNNQKGDFNLIIGKKSPLVLVTKLEKRATQHFSSSYE
jgi:hypothetical protein